tara:strand:+ start:458 stop:619 length:162 start_codon:yes stop_codon:yes gene_type:complete
MVQTQVTVLPRHRVKDILAVVAAVVQIHQHQTQGLVELAVVLQEHMTDRSQML